MEDLDKYLEFPELGSVIAKGRKDSFIAQGLACDGESRCVLIHPGFMGICS